MILSGKVEKELGIRPYRGMTGNGMVGSSIGYHNGGYHGDGHGDHNGHDGGYGSNCNY